MTRIGQWVMIGALGLLPVFFLPLTQDYYDTNKWALLMGATIIILILWGLRMLTTGTVTIAWNRNVKGLGILAAVSLISLPVSPNKIEALLTPFGLGTLLSLFLLSLVGSTFLDEKARVILRWVLMTAVSLSGLLAIYQFFGLGKDPLWSPVGPPAGGGLMTILVVTLPLLIAEAFHRKHAGHDTHMIVAIVMAIASLGGLLFTAYQVLPTWTPASPAGGLPYWVNWQMLLESYKNWKQLLVGVGAENFLAAFTAGRPAGLNETALWNTRFTVGSSLLFHFATVYGLVGAAATGWFLWPLRKGLMLAALTLLFLPPSLPALVVIITILMLHEPVHTIHLPLKHRPIFRYGLGVITVLLTASASYGLVRAYSGELAFGRSMRALEKNDGTGAYNFQIQAITFSPNVTRFHTTYSQTNLALANAISGAASASAAPTQLDRDRKTTTQLIQQAIREAKIAVNLSPTNILAWENIANVYQTLTGVAQGSDQWTVAAYTQAMQLDPTNPVIRLRLGGAYVGQQKLDQAVESYTAAISLKPDYANAYYNLAFAYREQKKYALAALALRETLKYVTVGTADGSRAQKELDEVSELLTKEEKLSLPPPRQK